jgi:hypothetical protein
MVRRSHDDLGTKSFSGYTDAIVVSSDGDVSERVATRDAFPDMLDERFAGKDMERLARKAG